MKGIMELPPKMAAQLAERAKRGEADAYHGGEVCEFYTGNIVVALVSYDPPIGHQHKVSTEQMAYLKDRSALLKATGGEA